jgi:hypothetical protein
MNSSDGTGSEGLPFEQHSYSDFSNSALLGNVWRELMVRPTPEISGGKTGCQKGGNEIRSA